MRTLRLGCVVGMVMVFAISFIGCGSESGGITDEPELVAQTFDERCGFCHGAGDSQDVAVVHDITSNSPVVSISAVREVDLGGGDTRLEVDVKIVDSDNPLVPIFIDVTNNSEARNIRFALAKLVTGAGGDMNWQSYINTTETKDSGDPGTGPDATVTQATTERGSTTTLSDNGNGQYTFQFSFNMNTVVDPVTSAAITYDRTATHRIAIQFSDNVSNAFVDFVPNDLPVAGTPIPVPAVNRQVSTSASCNECHVRLGFHGGDRKTVEYCVTCHNPGSTDANSGETVDFKVMIHKIHRGAELPAVQADGEYAIWGHNDNKYDYSTVIFSQDIRNCIKCHDGADTDTPEGDNWMDVPTAASCTSCHEDPGTIAGFPALTAQQITDAHLIPAQVAAGRFEFNIVSITNTAPGQFPVVTFSITDPTNADAPYDIRNDPEFTAPAGASRIAVLIGWNSSEYTNTNSGGTPAQPISLNPLSTAVDNGDGTFSVTSTTAIPGNITGSGVVAIEGHPAVETTAGSGTFNLRVPVTGVVQEFAITDSTAKTRRAVVSAAKCNQCHGLLSLHGGNRNNNTQLCVICHNADATDINRRPADITTTPDGKAEETIDFKYMIHGIHSAQFRDNGVVVYGFGGSLHDFSDVKMPNPSGPGTDNLNLLNCESCHLSGTFGTAFGANALPTTIKTGTNRTDPNDDENITTIASVCSSCHDNILSKTHMVEEGGLFDFKAFAPDITDGGDQIELCGPGPIGTQPAGHSPRLDCCSCHSPQ